VFLPKRSHASARQGVVAVRATESAAPFNPYGGSGGSEDGADVYMVDNSAPAKLQDGVRRHTISVFVADERGMINRVAGVFARRGFNIESLAVGLWGPSQDKALFTIVVLGADKFIKALVKQVYKLPNVRKVVLLTDVSRVERGLVLIKVATPPGTRTEIMELVSIFRGSVVDVSDETLTIAATGDPGKGIALQRALAKFGIRQIARTGRVALQRELRQEMIRARTDSERSMELDDAAKLAAPKSAGASAGAIGMDVYSSSVTADWMGIWEMDVVEEYESELPPGLSPHTLSVVVDNVSGVLDRVTGVIARRGYNIQSLAVGPSERRGVSRITMVVPGTDQSIAALLKQMLKLVSVIEATDISSIPFVQRELMMVKVLADMQGRSSVLQVAGIFRAKVSDISNETLVLEMVGDTKKMTACLQMLEPYGIVEVARTGRVALPRDNGVDSRMLEQIEMDSFF